MSVDMLSLMAQLLQLSESPGLHLMLRVAKDPDSGWFVRRRQAIHQ